MVSVCRTVTRFAAFSRRLVNVGELELLMPGSPEHVDPPMYSFA
jgi:hypothetical protein